MLKCFFCGKECDKKILDVCDECIEKHRQRRDMINEMKRQSEEAKIGKEKKKK